MNKNRMEGAAKQGERDEGCNALVTKATRRGSGGCAAKECVLAWGDLALRVLHSQRGCYARLAPKVMREPGEWLPHRLRALRLRQWRRWTTTFSELRPLGANTDLAARMAGNGRRWWRTGAGPYPDPSFPAAPDREAAGAC
jgi:hypothetical protein